MAYKAAIESMVNRYENSTKTQVQQKEAIPDMHGIEMIRKACDGDKADNAYRKLLSLQDCIELFKEFADLDEV